MRDDLEQLLSDWDGKATEALKSACEMFRAQPDFVDRLVGLSARQDTARGATWLLKHLFENGEPRLSESRTARHIAAMSDFSHWETRLHVLQYLDHLTIPHDAEAPLEAFILDALDSENKFLRAWAYYALALHAERFPVHKCQAIDRLNKAMMQETAGSVKVRIRKALERINP